MPSVLHCGPKKQGNNVNQLDRGIVRRQRAACTTTYISTIPCSKRANSKSNKTSPPCTVNTKGGGKCASSINRLGTFGCIYLRNINITYTSQCTISRKSRNAKPAGCKSESVTNIVSTYCILFSKAVDSAMPACIVCSPSTDRKSKRYVESSSSESELLDSDLDCGLMSSDCDKEN